MVARGPGGELVGTDEYGNKYFEQKDAILNRDRWVVFANSTHYTGQNPTVVSPEWHGWLHFITDDSPANVRLEFCSVLDLHIIDITYSLYFLGRIACSLRMEYD